LPLEREGHDRQHKSRRKYEAHFHLP
jgi:hypothetical protein